MSTTDGRPPLTGYGAFFNASGRMLVAARMVAPDGALSEQQRDELRSVIAAYIQQHGLTHKAVCKEIGGRIAANTLSEVLAGKYKTSPENLDELLRVLNNWMEVNARRRAAGTDRPFVETRVAEAILAAARFVAKRNYMGLVHGPSGVGKSRCIEALADQFPGSIVVRIAKGCRTHTQIIQRLAVESHAVGRRTGPYLSAWDGVRRSLRGSNRMLLIDEAHQIETSGLEALRDVYDECRVPIMLFCTIDLLDRIRADSDPDHGQMRRRIKYVLDLKGSLHLADGDDGRGVKQLFGVEDIRALYENSKVRLAADAQAMLVDIANDFGFGCLSHCETLVDNAIELLESASPSASKIMITAAVLRDIERNINPDRAMRSDIVGRTQRVRSRAAAG